jgi:hypothetical protein
VFRTYDGSLHWHFRMHVLGEDEYGVWIGAPAGGVARKGDGPPVLAAPRDGTEPFADAYRSWLALVA